MGAGNFLFGGDTIEKTQTAMSARPFYPRWLKRAVRRTYESQPTTQRVNYGGQQFEFGRQFPNELLKMFMQMSQPIEAITPTALNKGGAIPALGGFLGQLGQWAGSGSWPFK